ncbi:MAG: helix-turn-helix domain-containing protein [Actinomycetia bacterium]|nr:helix-turn-helix domain-containing protein [Actinomycetes bacterium]
MDQEIFRLRLSRARRNAGLTKRALAGRVGLSERAVGQFEQGETLPALPTAVALADALDVSLDWLTGRSDVPMVVRRRRLVFRRGPGKE